MTANESVEETLASALEGHAPTQLDTSRPPIPEVENLRMFFP
ncbi:MAG: hypothetical protein R2734_00315 [Nocardioides sp.]